MGKKIIILNGSPRPKGNTAGLIRAFTEGAEAAGHEVTTFLLDRMDIHGCKGCYGGGKNPDHPCVQQDGMDKIYPVFREADVVVMASPLYFWTLSGQLRTATDRLFALMEGNETALGTPRESVLLMAAESHEFEEASYYYDRLMEHMGWQNRGKVLAGGVARVGDIEGKPALEEARRLGGAI